MNRQLLSSAALLRMKVWSITMAVLGLLLAGFSLGLEWHGFLGGLALGAGLTLGLAGVYYWGRSDGMRKPAVSTLGGRKMWRPSEGPAK